MLDSRGGELVNGPKVSPDDDDRFKRLIARLHVGVVVQGPESEILIVNQAALDLLGVSEEQILGMTSFDPYWRIIRENGLDFPASERPVAQVVATRTRAANVVMGVHRPRTKDVSWLLVNAEPEFDSNGALVQVVATLGDITELKRLEASLLQSRKLESIGRLAGGIAHDFNNLLTVILGATSLALATLPEDVEGRSELTQSLHAAERAAALTRQLLTFARRQVTIPQRVELEPALRDLEPLLARLLGGHVALRVRPQPGTWGVQVDPAQLEQIIVNLVVNARDAMPDGGTIDVETFNLHVDVPPGDYAVIRVADTGQGIDARTRERLFEPFFTTKEAGSGLGLATVYGIVEKHGGFITVQSEPHRGASFCIHLPRSQPRGDEVAANAATPLGDVQGRETILLIEDEELIRLLGKRVLEESGYRVLLASDGVEGLEVARTSDIDLVMTDLLMPRLDGARMATQLLAMKPRTKIIFTSGYTDELPLLSTARFLPKPYTPTQLREFVRATLDERAES